MRSLMAFALVFCTTSLVSAQWGGSFTTYGAGCQGTGGGGICYSTNMDCLAAHPRAADTDQYAVAFKVAGQAALATGVRIRAARLATAPGSYTVQIWKTDTAGKPTAQLGQTAKIKVGTLYANYLGKFPAPIPLVPGNYALVHQAAGSVSQPVCFPSSCQKTCATTTFYQRPSTGGSWNGPWSRVWTFDVVCFGMGSVPLMSNTGVPTVNKSFSVDLNRAAANVPCALFIGATRKNLDLTVLGAPSCILLAAADVVLGMTSSATGTAMLKVAVPNNQWLVNKTLDFQWVVIDAGANRLGIAMSAGGEAFIGP